MLRTVQTQKKGQSLGGLYSGILVIASICVLLALMLYVYSAMGNSFQVANTAGTVTNETGADINTTGYTLALAGADDFANPVITALWGAEGGEYNVSIATANVTVTSAGVMTNATVYTNGNVSVSYTYTYSADTAASNSTGTMTTQFVSFLPWLGIILLVLAAGVVLFFIIRTFVTSKTGV